MLGSRSPNQRARAAYRQYATLAPHSAYSFAVSNGTEVMTPSTEQHLRRIRLQVCVLHGTKWGCLAPPSKHPLLARAFQFGHQAFCADLTLTTCIEFHA